MNNHIVLFLLIISLSTPLLGQDCVKMEVSEAMQKADLIVSGEITAIHDVPDGQGYEVKLEEHFKKSEVLLEALIFDSKDIKQTPRLKVGQRYLIYGIKKNDYWVTTSCEMRTMPLSEAGHDLRYLRENLTCKNEAPIKQNNERGCPRNISPVCGCDGYTYDNACYAFKAGVSWWEPGKCE